MTNDELRVMILAALRRIAPEADAATLAPDRPLRDQVDLDSMDFLNFLMELRRDTGVDVPESDYAQVATLDGIVAYLGGRLTAAPAGPQPDR